MSFVLVDSSATLSVSSPRSLGAVRDARLALPRPVLVPLIVSLLAHALAHARLEVVVAKAAAVLGALLLFEVSGPRRIVVACC